MLPLQKVSEIINRHSELEKDLSSSNLDSKTFAKKSKEYSDLNEIIKNAQDYFNFNDNKNELDKIINDRNSDEEMKQLAIKLDIKTSRGNWDELVAAASFESMKANADHTAPDTQHKVWINNSNFFPQRGKRSMARRSRLIKLRHV